MVLGIFPKIISRQKCVVKFKFRKKIRFSENTFLQIEHTNSKICGQTIDRFLVPIKNDTIFVQVCKVAH